MSTITPIFQGSYSNGQLIYNNTLYAIGDGFKYYVDSMEIVFDSIHDRKLTGFADTKYLQNSTDTNNASGSIAITMVGDLPQWLAAQLLQLSKAVIGSGMSLEFIDDFCSNNIYKCKWENAGDFVENNAVLGGGSLLFKFYSVANNSAVIEFDSGVYELESGVFEF